MEKERSVEGNEEKTIPVIEEKLRVGKRTVETGVTRVKLKVHNVEQVIEEPLVKQDVLVQHVPINRYIDRPVRMRTEGEVMIIPVMEEVLVVEKKLRLVEELHISQHTETVKHRQNEVVRKEEAVVEHTDLRRQDH